MTKDRSSDWKDQGDPGAAAPALVRPCLYSIHYLDTPIRMLDITEFPRYQVTCRNKFEIAVNISITTIYIRK